MPKVIDLSMPIENHFRWAVERKVKGDFAAGDPFQVTLLSWTVHGFTHVDSPRHMVPGGPTTSDFDLDDLVGEAAIVDLTGIAPNTAIGPAHLQGPAAHVRDGDRVILKTAWDTKVSYRTPEFWTTAPYMTREACEWLLAKRIRAIGYDFPQDYPIRGLLSGEQAGIEDFVTHDVLLRNGVIMIEYLCNLAAVDGARATIVALPLKVPEADGAPARVIAWQ